MWRCCSYFDLALTVSFVHSAVVWLWWWWWWWSAPGQIVQQMYVIACVLGAGLQMVLLTQAPAILALMGAGPSTALFKEASGYLKVCCFLPLPPPCDVLGSPALTNSSVGVFLCL